MPGFIIAGSEQKTVNDNAGVVSNIQAAIAENKTPSANDKRVLQSAQDVRKQTSELVSYIEGLRQMLIDKTGGPNEDGTGYAQPEGNDIVAINMIGAASKNNGAAYDLKGKLNNYAKFLKQYNPNTPDKLALDGSEDPVASNDPTQRRKDFAQLNFEETPMVAALAVLSQKESEVLKYEADALQKLAQQVGADIIKFEKIFAMARAESKTVAAWYQVYCRNVYRCVI
ncbi:hypothetical protein [Pontibacter rugosus]